MKKIIVMVSILFIFAIGILGYYFNDYKNNSDKEIVEINTKQVNLVDSKALNNVKIGNAVISNILIENNKYLKFHIDFSRNTMPDRIISVSLYNDYAKNPGIVIDKKLNEVMKNNEVIIDIGEAYNNPSTIEFDIK